MPFLKEDLLKDHYNWNSENASLLYMGEPTRRQFDRFNGNQVLFILNVYGSLSEKVSLTEVRKMEEMIFYELPLDAKSEISVFNWLKNVFAIEEKHQSL